jgi:hypothetical protein
MRQQPDIMGDMFLLVALLLATPASADDNVQQ